MIGRARRGQRLDQPYNTHRVIQQSLLQLVNPAVPCSTFNVRRSTFDVRRWMLDVGCWMLDVGCWMLDVGCWMLDVGCFSPAPSIGWSPGIACVNFIPAPQMPITVSVVEDNRGTRDTLLELLNRTPGLQCLTCY